MVANPKIKAAAKPRSVKAKSASLVKFVHPDPVASDYAVGDAIKHPTFGAGVVTVVEERKLTIQFAGGRFRQVMDDYVDLVRKGQNLETAKPVAAATAGE